MKLLRLASVSALLAAALGLTLLGAPTQAGVPMFPASRVSSLTWRDCGGGFQCTRMSVPLDYRRPSGATVSLKLIRLPAARPGRRIGSLFVNPGGPGDSGIAFLRHEAKHAFLPSVRARFDLVGFDPRGVGASTPLQCFDSNHDELRAYRDVPLFPMTRGEVRKTVVANARLTTACARRMPSLARHVTTGEVARDLDRMRAAVGDTQLSFVGYSYGSYLATVYANLYPQRVRAVVADGVVNPRAWLGRGRWGRRVPIDVRLQSDTGTSASLHAFLRACDRHSRACAFSPPGPTRSRHRFARLMRVLRSHPVSLASGPVSYADAVSAVRYDLYDVDRWTSLGRYLRRLWVHRSARTGAARTPAAADPTQSLLHHTSRSSYYNYLDIAEAVTCSDSHNPSTPHTWTVYGRRRDRVAPYFGRWWTWLDEACATWSLPSPERYDGPFDRVTAHPVLVVGNLRDPATRYRDAVSLSRILPRAAPHGGRNRSHLARCAQPLRRTPHRCLPAAPHASGPGDDVPHAGAPVRLTRPSDD